MGVIFRGAVAQGESFRGNCLGSKIPWDNCPGGISYGVIVRGGNYSGAIVWGAKIWGLILLSGIS